MHVEKPLRALYKNYLLFTIHVKVRIIELFWLVNFGNIIQSERSLHILSEMIWFIDRVCPNVRHENITLWSSSWRLKFIHSQFPLPMALNSVFSFIKMSDRDLKFVYLFCQTDKFLFVIETPIRINVNILLVGTSTCKTWNIKTEIYYWAQK